MKKILHLCAFSILVLFCCYQISFAQNYSSSDWMNDKPYQDMVSSMSRYSSSSSRSSKSKSKRDRDSRSSVSYYDYSAELRRQVEAAAEAERLRIVEAERIRKEDEFRADKAELQETLRGYESSGSTSSYGSGLRGLSNDDSNNYGRSSYSSGLRGVSDDSNPVGGKANYSAGLKGYSEETTKQNTYENSPEGIGHKIGSNFSEVNGSRPLSVEERSNSYSNNAVISSSSQLGKNRENKINPISDYRGSDSYDYENELDNSIYSVAQKRFQTTRDYTSYVSVYDPQPVYYQGPGSRFYMMGVADDMDESWFDKIEEKIDIWREAGEQKVLTYIGDNLTGFARETVAKSSAVGAWFYKLLDIANEGVGLKNLVVKTAKRDFDAINRSTATMNPRYVNEVNKINKKDIDSYALTTFEKKGLLPPSPRALDKKAQKVTGDVVETGATKGFEIWLSRRNKE